MDKGTYWRAWHGAPVEAWQPALAVIRARFDLPDGEWTRFPRGRNVFFALDDRLVVKLVPPFWAPGAEREAAALRVVDGQLPVATPTLLAFRRLDDWSCLIQTRLPGQVMADLWPDLPLAERETLASQQGWIMRALHDLPVPPEAPRIDWVGMLVDQALDAPGELARAGLDTILLDGLRAYLDSWRLSWEGRVALLHGDLDAINLLVQREENGRWRVTGLSRRW